MKGATIDVGARVLGKKVAFDGKHKIADRWEDEPYLVITKPNKDIPVYTVRREDGIGKSGTLHRDLLLPLGSACVELDQDERPRKPKPAPRTKTKHRDIPEIETCTGTYDQTSDEEVNYLVPRTDSVDGLQDEASEDETVCTVDDVEPDVEEAGAADTTDREEPTDLSDSADESPEDKSRSLRPQRRRQPPYWLRSGKYITKL